MPKVSKETATNVADLGVLEERSEELDGYRSASRPSVRTPTPRRSSRDCPTTAARAPHWGYVIRGKVTFRYADHDEVYETGDAYYAPPGHIPVVTADTEVVEFSPTEEYARTMEVVARNMAAAAVA